MKLKGDVEEQRYKTSEVNDKLNKKLIMITELERDLEKERISKREIEK